MVDIGRIILGVLCGYVGFGLLFNLYVDHYINNCTIGELLGKQPLSIRLGNKIFYPIQLIRLLYILYVDRIEENEDM